MRARQVLIAAAAVLGLGGAAWFLLKGDAKDAKLAFEPRELSFGRVPFGDEVVRTLTIANRSGREVIVHDVLANCRCFFVSRTYSRLLHPGDSTEVSVALRSSLVPAEPLRGKRLTVISSEGQAEVPLKGEILEVRRVSPMRIDLGEIPREGPADKGPWVVRVRPGPGFEVRLVSAVLEPPGDLVVETAPAEDGTDVTLRLSPTAAGAGSFHATLVLTLEAKGEDGRTRSFTDRVAVDGIWK